jgi:hypothetical protein
MTDLWHRNDTLVTVGSTYSNIPRSTSMHFAARVLISCCSFELIFTFLYADSSIKHTIVQFVSCFHLSSVNFAHRSAPQNKSLTELNPIDSNSSVSVPIQNLTHVHTFFPTTTDAVTTQNTEISSLVTLYLRVEQGCFSRYEVESKISRTGPAVYTAVVLARITGRW